MTGLDATDELMRKLNLIQGASAYILYAPEGYYLSHEAKPVSSVTDISGKADWIQAFYVSSTKLESDIKLMKSPLSHDGQLWLCWPKKTSVVKTDLSDTLVRRIGLNVGLVDVKVASIDATWSGLKFVYRSVDR